MATTTDPTNPRDDARSFSPLFEVDAEEVAAILGMPLPPHETVFDDARLLDLVAGSFSLTREEKEEIVRSLPRLSQEQIESLLQILADEREKFRDLNERHARRLAELEKEDGARDAEKHVCALLGQG